MGVILLVRHGQASFGTADYDRLSAAGLDQSRRTGVALALQDLGEVRLVSGRMRRQLETAAALGESASWGQDAEIDAAWDEFDASSFLLVRPEGDSAVFQRALDAGMREWAAERVGAEDVETFKEFAARVEDGLRRLADAGGVAVVSTSAGAISWAVSSLLGGGVEEWIRLNRVCVNAAVTKIVTGRSGASLVSFNEHAHLAPGAVTYR